MLSYVKFNTWYTDIPPDIERVGANWPHQAEMQSLHHFCERVLEPRNREKHEMEKPQALTSEKLSGDADPLENWFKGLASSDKWKTNKYN